MAALAPVQTLNQTSCQRIILDPTLTPQNASPIPFPLSEGIQAGKCEYNGFTGREPLHGFVGALHRAFSYHLPLQISPDDIWTVIMQSVSEYVEKNAEQVRHYFVSHAGKQDIRVRRDHMTPGRTTRDDWMHVIKELTDKTCALTHGQVATHAIQRFTTTQPIHAFGYQAALLSTLRHYFRYVVESYCGIPAIELTGTVADWDQLVTAFEALDVPKLGASRWHACALPVLKQLADAKRHESSPRPIDVEFLKNIYKFKQGSGGNYVTGWVAFLFAYLSKHDAHLHVGKIPHVRSDGFPAGLVRVPFKWDYLGKQTFDMLIFEGFDDPQTAPDGTVSCVHAFAVEYAERLRG